MIYKLLYQLNIILKNLNFTQIMIVLQNVNSYLIPFINVLLNVLFKPGVLFDFDQSDDEMVLKVSAAEHNCSSLFYNELYSPIIIYSERMYCIDCMKYSLNESAD